MKKMTKKMDARKRKESPKANLDGTHQPRTASRMIKFIKTIVAKGRRRRNDMHIRPFSDY